MSYREFKVEKLYYTIGEVSEILGENSSLIRFWSDKFSQFIKPARNKKGNRLFTAKDVSTLKLIHYLVKERGMTLEGAAKSLSANRDGSDRRLDVIERLIAIRERLEMVAETL